MYITAISISDTTYNTVFSMNYGNSFTSITTAYQSYSLCMNSSGSIQVISSSAGFYISQNFGETWNLIPYNTTITANSLCMSSSGQYALGSMLFSNLILFQNSIQNNNGIISLGKYGGTASGVTGVAGSLFYDTTKTAGAASVMVSTGSSWVTVKSFVIDHPTDKSRYLVHGCIEGPEAGVYYRGRGEITNHEYTVIELPAYVQHIATNITIQISDIYDGYQLKTYNSGPVIGNTFKVYGPNGNFYWIVHGTRLEIDVEPYKEKTIVKGDGPYKWV